MTYAICATHAQLHRDLRTLCQTGTRVLNAVAIEILIFLIGDVFVDAAGSLYNGSLYGYGTSPSYDILFTLSLAAGFLILRPIVLGTSNAQRKYLAKSEG